MNERERTLRELGAAIEYPPTPPIAAAVRRRLQAEGAPGAGSRPLRPLRLRTALLATALFLLLAGGVLAAVPSARHALLDLVGLRGAAIERVETLPAGVEARPGSGLGPATTLAAARRRLSFRPLLPSGLGDPDGVFLAAGNAPPGGELLLAYRPRPGLPRSRFTGVGLLVDEIDGSFAPGFFGKLVPRGVRIERLRVDGDEAAWIEGLHQFFYKDAAQHIFRIGRTRLAGNTLLLQRGPVMVRIEGRFGRARALAIARSLGRRADESAPTRLQHG